MMIGSVSTTEPAINTVVGTSILPDNCDRPSQAVQSGRLSTRKSEAIDHLGCTPPRTELARAYLLNGEWLRREGRRVDARARLRDAYEEFAAIGMTAFASALAVSSSPPVNASVSAAPVAGTC